MRASRVQHLCVTCIFLVIFTSRLVLAHEVGGCKDESVTLNLKVNNVKGCLAPGVNVSLQSKPAWVTNFSPTSAPLGDIPASESQTATFTFKIDPSAPDGANDGLVFSITSASGASWTKVVPLTAHSSDTEPPQIALSRAPASGVACEQDGTISWQVTDNKDPRPTVLKGLDTCGVVIPFDLVTPTGSVSIPFSPPDCKEVAILARDECGNQTKDSASVRFIDSDFEVTVSPTFQSYTKKDEVKPHTINVKNNGKSGNTFCARIQIIQGSQSIEILERDELEKGTFCFYVGAGETHGRDFHAKAVQVPGKDLIYKLSVKVQGCETEQPQWALGKNGKAEITDHPDDLQDVSSIKAGTLGTISASAKTVVLMTGFFDGMGSLLQKLNEPVNLLLEDLTLLEPGKTLKDYPVMILPSGALAGLETSETVKALLDDYVKSGGVLIAFSQQRGYEFSALPGGKLSGYGWREDQSCLANAAFIDAYHPIFASQTKTNIDANIDGYFTLWPDDATILLRRVKNNYPAMLVYPYGEGVVLATTMYPDFGLLSGQTTPDELNFMRDVLAWAKNPKASFTESNPQEQLTLTLQLVNSTTQNANSAKLTVKDNGGQVFKEETVTVSVPAGETVSYAYTLLAPAALGNYTVSYALLFDTQTVQAQTFTDAFSVSEHLQSTTPAPEFQFSVNAPGDTFPLNFPITFTIRIKNNGETERTLTLSKTGHGANETIGTFTVPAASEVTVPFTTSAVYHFDVLRVKGWIWDMYLNVNDEQGKEILGGWNIGVGGKAYTPSVSASVTADKKSYGPNEVGTLTLHVTNTTVGPFDANVTVSIVNPLNQKLFEEAMPVSFNANETKTESFSFTLPASLIPGPYTVQASITRDGGEIGKATGYFTVEKAKVAIVPQLPAYIVPSSSNTLSFSLQNTGALNIASGTFALTAKDTEGASFFTESQAFALNVSEQKTLNFSIPFPALQFGTYKLSYSATTETGTILGSTSLNAQPLFTLTPDKPSYKAGETAQLSLKVTNPDIFEMNFSITLSAPSVSFTQTQNVSLSPKAQQTLTFSMPVTNAANAGTNALLLTASIAKPYTQNFSFFVQPAKFSATLDKFEYTLNEQGNVTMTNAGGLDASATYTLTLTDKDGVVVENASGTLSLPVMASANIPVTFTKPEILSGMYRLSVLIKDTRSSLKFPFEQYVTYSGVSATVSVTPTKSVYTQNETPTMKTKVTPTGNLQNAKLTVKILNPNPKISPYAQIGASASVLVDPPYIWFGTMYHGAKRLEKNTNSITDILPNTYIYALAADNAYVYLGTEAALYRYDKATGALANFPVTAIRAFSRDGSFLWIGTDKGVKKWDTLNEIVTESYTTQNGLPENPIWTLLADGNRVYIATFNKGLFMLDKLSKTLAPVSGLPDLRIRGIAIDNDALWMATWNGVVKLNRKTQEVMQTFNTAQGLADKFTFSIAVDGNWLWVGTLSGLSKYDKSDNTWKTYTKADGMSSNYVRSLAVDAENVYLGCFMK